MISSKQERREFWSDHLKFRVKNHLKQNKLKSGHRKTLNLVGMALGYKDWENYRKSEIGGHYPYYKNLFNYSKSEAYKKATKNPDLKEILPILNLEIPDDDERPYHILDFLKSVCRKGKLPISKINNVLLRKEMFNSLQLRNGEISEGEFLYIEYCECESVNTNRFIKVLDEIWNVFPNLKIILSSSSFDSVANKGIFEIPKHISWIDLDVLMNTKSINIEYISERLSSGLLITNEKNS
ncbi:hypothetical protein [Maribacter luteus]|uniref:hypothetical protein n=1 Tax=Maribacter luteus TaxID=2594478 RepID=UPI00248FD5D4|nr:hypothetical protein [Maribacter luteus]